MRVSLCAAVLRHREVSCAFGLTGRKGMGIKSAGFFFYFYNNSIAAFQKKLLQMENVSQFSGSF